MATNISTILISGSAERIWKTLTDPELVKQWQYGSILTTTWEINSDIKFATEWQGKVFEQRGKVLELEPNKLLRYSLFAPAPGRVDKPENYFIMSYILTEAEGAVKLQIIQEDNRPGAVQEEPQGEESPLLQSLKQIAEQTREELFV